MSTFVATVGSVFDRDGVRKDEVTTSFKRSWVLNGVAKCTFKVPSIDFRESLQLGNLILLESSVFPLWGGVIDYPRAWNSDGRVTINAYSGERLLFGRRAVPAVDMVGDSGMIFQHLIEQANAQYPTRVNADQVWHGGDEIKKTPSAQSIYDEIMELSKETGCDWEVVPVLSDSGRLSFSANWSQRLGEEIRHQSFMEGFNIELGNPAMDEQEPEGGFYNDLLGYGNGSVWNDKIKVIFDRQESKDAYGVQEGFLRVDTDSPAMLNLAVINALDKGSRIRRTFNFSALDEGDLFSVLKKGNLLELEMHTCGYSSATQYLIRRYCGGQLGIQLVPISRGAVGTKTVVKVIGMTVDDDYPGKVGLVVDEAI